MDSASSPTYSLADALVTPKSMTINVSQWYSDIMYLYSSKVNRLNRKKKWIQLVKKYISHKFTENLYNEHRTVTKYVFVDASKLIWRSFSKKLLLQSRLFVIQYYYIKLLQINYERRINIKIQWKSYAWALLHGFESPKHSYRELWRTYAFLINKKRIKEASKSCHKLSFQGKNQTQMIWQRFSRFVLCHTRIKQMKIIIRAICILTKFFNRSLIKFRAQKAARSVISFDIDYSFTKPFVIHSCKEINHFSKLYLMRRAKDFSHAYADETFKTSFVHALNAIRADNSP